MKKFATSLASVFISSLLVFNSVSSLSTQAAYTRELPNYPVYRQIGNNCWAYAILSMANYKYGGYSINDIYIAYEKTTGKTYDYEGANVNEALSVMRYIFSNYNPVKKGELTSNEIKLEINSNFPVYIRGDGHAVALMGYRSLDASSNVSVIYYMNSATGSIMYTGYTEGTGNTFYTNSSQVYNWENSIIISG